MPDPDPDKTPPLEASCGRPLCLFKAVYDLALLEARTKGGVPLSVGDRSRRSQLEQLLAGDGPDGRRRHARIAMELPAALKADGTWIKGTIVDLSAGGLRLRSSWPTRVGDRMVVEISRAEPVSYFFSGTVCRTGATDLALAFDAVPLELRRGGYSSHDILCQRCLAPHR